MPYNRFIKIEYNKDNLQADSMVSWDNDADPDIIASKLLDACIMIITECKGLPKEEAQRTIYRSFLKHDTESHPS